MVLPEALLNKIKQRARMQGLSITAYITGLVVQDLASPTVAGPRLAIPDSPLAGSPDWLALAAQVDNHEQRIRRLEQSSLGPRGGLKPANPTTLDQTSTDGLQRL